MGTFIEKNADLPLFRDTWTGSPPPGTERIQFTSTLARPSDPPTSHEAARRSRSFASGHRLLILQALESWPAGQTEIARRTGLTVAAVSRRLGELARGGLIVRDGDAISASGGREASYRRCG